MKVLLDTSIWSAVLRRKWWPEEAATHDQFSKLVLEQRIAIIGAVRQEVLSGLKDRAEFDRLRGLLRRFEDTEITVEDYEQAASFFNRCRAKGVQGSHTDFLICAIAERHNFSIFTHDQDFTRFAKILPITLYESVQ